MMTGASVEAAGRFSYLTTLLIVSSKAATLFSKDSCSFCIRAKMLLEQNGVDFDYVDLTGDLDGQVELARRTGRMTMPQVFVGDELIGGFEDLVLALRNPRIREALGVV
jgi:glutaredoxin 3